MNVESVNRARTVEAKIKVAKWYNFFSFRFLFTCFAFVDSQLVALNAFMCSFGFASCFPCTQLAGARWTSNARLNTFFPFRRFFLFSLCSLPRIILCTLCVRVKSHCAYFVCSSDRTHWSKKDVIRFHAHYVCVRVFGMFGYTQQQRQHNVRCHIVWMIYDILWPFSVRRFFPYVSSSSSRHIFLSLTSWRNNNNNQRIVIVDETTVNSWRR